MDDSGLREAFVAAQSRLQGVELSRLGEEISDHWAHGRVSTAALISAAALPRIVPESIWPFIDLGELSVARWYLAASHLRSQPVDSELWFSWVVAEESWAVLTHAAQRAPEGAVRTHLSGIVSGLERCRNFSEFDEAYDYGVMITPWNHFHLAWVALRLRDQVSALAHAEALCTLAANTDIRARRFVVRLSNWTVFRAILELRGLKARVDSLCSRFTASRATRNSLLGSDLLVPQMSFKRALEALWDLTTR